MNLFGLPPRDLWEIPRRAGEELTELRGQRVFLTGGTGFFGKWLLGALIHADRELGLDLRLTVLSREPGEFLRRYPELTEVSGVKFLAGDVSTFSLADERPDYVLHAATDTTAFTTEAEEQARARTIVAGTERVLELAKRNGTRRLLNISSGAVYGAEAARLSGAEEEYYAAAKPLTVYGRAKREAEQLCVDSGVSTTTARAFAFLGPYLPLDAHFAAGNFLRDARRGGPIMVRGDGTALRSYLHPVDLVVWLLRMLVGGERSRAYNVGSDEVVSTAELARLIAEAVNPASEVVVQSSQPQGPQNIYLPNVERARRELGLKIGVPLREAIGRTLEYLVERGNKSI